MRCLVRLPYILRLSGSSLTLAAAISSGLVIAESANASLLIHRTPTTPRRPLTLLLVPAVCQDAAHPAHLKSRAKVMRRKEGIAPPLLPHLHHLHGEKARWGGNGSGATMRTS